MLLDLVGNPITFTDAGEVRVIAKAVKGHFAVSVMDTGPGIPEQEPDALDLRTLVRDTLARICLLSQPGSKLCDPHCLAPGRRAIAL